VPGRAFQARDPLGHIWATLHPSVRDNSGYWRVADTPAQQLYSSGITGHPTTPVLSRTEEVAWASIRAGSVPQRARAGIGGHQRSQGLKAAGRPPSDSSNWMLQAANQLAVPEVVDIPGVRC
jgi:hypothetical protein